MRRTTATSIAVALVAMTALPAAAERPPHWDERVACADVFVIGVRGSGEDRRVDDAERGFGPRAVALLDAAAQMLLSRGIRLAAASVDYPAIGVDDAARSVFSFEPKGYDDSVDAGVTDLGHLVTEVRSRCPGAVIVLVGYSQGAEVIRLALSRRVVVADNDIAAVVLVSDPGFNAADARSGVNLRGTYSSSRTGVRRSTLSLVTPTGIAERTFSLCNAGDIVCQMYRGPLPLALLDWNGAIDVHRSYGIGDVLPILQRDVLPLIAARLDPAALGRFVRIPF
ncbi:MAG: cutinase family protein [Acidimicrobiia bacterium]